MLSSLNHVFVFKTVYAINIHCSEDLLFWTVQKMSIEITFFKLHIFFFIDSFLFFRLWVVHISCCCWQWFILLLHSFRLFLSSSSSSLLPFCSSLFPSSSCILFMFSSFLLLYSYVLLFILLVQLLLKIPQIQ